MVAVTLHDWAYLTAGTASLVKVIVLVALIPGMLALGLKRIAYALAAAAASLAIYGAAFMFIFLRIELPGLWWWPPLMLNMASIILALVWLRDRVIEPLAHVVCEAADGT